MEFGLWDIIQILASGLGILLCILIFQNRENKTANIWVALLMASISVQLVNGILYSQNFYLHNPGLGLYLTSNIFLIPPLHFLYVKFLITPRLIFRPGHVFYFSLYIVLNVYFVRWYFADSQSILGFIDVHPFFVQNIVSIAHSLAFLLASLYLLKKYKTALYENLSNTERVDLRWLYVITFSALCYLFLITVFFTLSAAQLIGYYPEKPLMILFSLFMLVVGYYGLSQPQIFYTLRVKYTREKYASSGLTDQKRMEVKHELERLLITDKVYMKEDLNITFLAELLKISPNYLSQIINEDYKQNFYSYINGLRIEEVKKRLTTSDLLQETIIGMAYDAGFSSKSVFYKHFKKQLGMTPRQYINTIQKSDEK